ncbi:uncharacterized protein LOC8280126 isoform X2 [Ricinus communis]|uniref:uncharacterized protein LOC8280126 isoform X2 n=1 Tax=Ricinus communis TaxID=3988 RepID=UPI000772557F|nr:uncharacterized protein LOC8280126 isoform X2 [Ricinus communis]|eukprot:XP_015575106.1 uncharacterized protein LOC8280126 isoform X2 [Ricinus communis]
MGIIMILVTKPFSLCKSVFMYGLQIMFFVIHAWVELVTTSINVHLNIFHKTMIWTIALITLPIRVLSALQRERLLQDTLHEMQIELDNLVWVRKELQHQLQTAIKECRILESMLAEVEDENETIIAKFELLESEGLKVENLQLKEILSEGHWSFKFNGGTDNAENIGIAISNNTGISDSTQSCCKASEMMLEDLVTNKDACEGEGKSEAELRSFLRATARGSIHSFSHSIVSRSLDMSGGLDQRRDAAVFQSLFSAVLTLLVGTIIWKAEDPCMPLVVALFAVVGMSLKSVVQFFSTIKNKPASDAVALLSLNWFILGTLTYPALPKVARIIAALTLNVLDWTVS